MTYRSAPGLLVLHAVRVLGFADTRAVAARAGIGDDDGETTRLLTRAEHDEWVRYAAFADLGGWSLTDSGRAENERQLAAELVVADPHGEVEAVHRDFVPLNARLLRAVTDWQIRPTPADRFSANDHTDRDWDERVLAELAALDRELGPLVRRLSAVLARFDGYADRFGAALRLARTGQHAWVDTTAVDSCHRVWFQLHEDLVATLGIDRGA